MHFTNSFSALFKKSNKGIKFSPEVINESVSVNGVKNPWKSLSGEKKSQNLFISHHKGVFGEAMKEVGMMNFFRKIKKTLNKKKLNDKTAVKERSIMKFNNDLEEYFLSQEYKNYKLQTLPRDIPEIKKKKIIKCWSVNFNVASHEDFGEKKENESGAKEEKEEKEKEKEEKERKESSWRSLKCSIMMHNFDYSRYLKSCRNKSMHSINGNIDFSENLISMQTSGDYHIDHIIDFIGCRNDGHIRPIIAQLHHLNASGKRTGLEYRDDYADFEEDFHFDYDSYKELQFVRNGGDLEARYEYLMTDVTKLYNLTKEDWDVFSIVYNRLCYMAFANTDEADYWLEFRNTGMSLLNLIGMIHADNLERRREDSKTCQITLFETLYIFKNHVSRGSSHHAHWALSAMDIKYIAIRYTWENIGELSALSNDYDDLSNFINSEHFTDYENVNGVLPYCNMIINGKEPGRISRSVSKEDNEKNLQEFIESSKRVTSGGNKRYPRRGTNNLQDIVRRILEKKAIQPIDAHIVYRKGQPDVASVLNWVREEGHPHLVYDDGKLISSDVNDYHLQIALDVFLIVIIFTRPNRTSPKFYHIPVENSYCYESFRFDDIDLLTSNCNSIIGKQVPMEKLIPRTRFENWSKRHKDFLYGHSVLFKFSPRQRVVTTVEIWARRGYENYFIFKNEESENEFVMVPEDLIAGFFKPPFEQFFTIENARDTSRTTHLTSLKSLSHRRKNSKEESSELELNVDTKSALTIGKIPRNIQELFKKNKTLDHTIFNESVSVKGTINVVKSRLASISVETTPRILVESFKFITDKKFITFRDFLEVYTPMEDGHLLILGQDVYYNTLRNIRTIFNGKLNFIIIDSQESQLLVLRTFVKQFEIQCDELDVSLLLKFSSDINASFNRDSYKKNLLCSYLINHGNYSVEELSLLMNWTYNHELSSIKRNLTSYITNNMLIQGALTRNQLDLIKMSMVKFVKFELSSAIKSMIDLKFVEDIDIDADTRLYFESLGFIRFDTKELPISSFNSTFISNKLSQVPVDVEFNFDSTGFVITQYTLFSIDEPNRFTDEETVINRNEEFEVKTIEKLDLYKEGPDVFTKGFPKVVSEAMRIFNEAIEKILHSEDFYTSLEGFYVQNELMDGVFEENFIESQERNECCADFAILGKKFIDFEEPVISELELFEVFLNCSELGNLESELKSYISEIESNSSFNTIQAQNQAEIQGLLGEFNEESSQIQPFNYSDAPNFNISDSSGEHTPKAPRSPRVTLSEVNLDEEESFNAADLDDSDESDAESDEEQPFNAADLDDSDEEDTSDIFTFKFVNNDNENDISNSIKNQTESIETENIQSEDINTGDESMIPNFDLSDEENDNDSLFDEMFMPSKDPLEWHNGELKNLLWPEFQTHGYNYSNTASFTNESHTIVINGFRKSQRMRRIRCKGDGNCGVYAISLVKFLLGDINYINNCKEVPREYDSEGNTIWMDSTVVYDLVNQEKFQEIPVYSRETITSIDFEGSENKRRSNKLKICIFCGESGNHFDVCVSSDDFLETAINITIEKARKADMKLSEVISNIEEAFRMEEELIKFSKQITMQIYTKRINNAEGDDLEDDDVIDDVIETIFGESQNELQSRDEDEESEDDTFVPSLKLVNHFAADHEADQEENLQNYVKEEMIFNYEIVELPAEEAEIILWDSLLCILRFNLSYEEFSSLDMVYMREKFHEEHKFNFTDMLSDKYYFSKDIHEQVIEITPVPQEMTSIVFHSFSILCLNKIYDELCNSYEWENEVNEKPLWTLWDLHENLKDHIDFTIYLDYENSHASLRPFKNGVLFKFSDAINCCPMRVFMTPDFVLFENKSDKIEDKEQEISMEITNETLDTYIYPVLFDVDSVMLFKETIERSTGSIAVFTKDPLDDFYLFFFKEFFSHFMIDKNTTEEDLVKELKIKLREFLRKLLENATMNAMEVHNLLYRLTSIFTFGTFDELQQDLEIMIKESSLGKSMFISTTAIVGNNRSRNSLNKFFGDDYSALPDALNRGKAIILDTNCFLNWKFYLQDKRFYCVFIVFEVIVKELFIVARRRSELKEFKNFFVRFITMNDVRILRDVENSSNKGDALILDDLLHYKLQSSIFITQDWRFSIELKRSGFRTWDSLSHFSCVLYEKEESDSPVASHTFFNEISECYPLYDLDDIHIYQIKDKFLESVLRVNIEDLQVRTLDFDTDLLDSVTRDVVELPNYEYDFKPQEPPSYDFKELLSKWKTQINEMSTDFIRTNSVRIPPDFMRKNLENGIDKFYKSVQDSRHKRIIDREVQVVPKINRFHVKKPDEFLPEPPFVHPDTSILDYFLALFKESQTTKVKVTNEMKVFIDTDHQFKTKFERDKLNSFKFCFSDQEEFRMRIPEYSSEYYYEDLVGRSDEIRKLDETQKTDVKYKLYSMKFLENLSYLHNHLIEDSQKARFLKRSEFLVSHAGFKNMGYIICPFEPSNRLDRRIKFRYVFTKDDSNVNNYDFYPEFSVTSQGVTLLISRQYVLTNRDLVMRSRLYPNTTPLRMNTDITSYIFFFFLLFWNSQATKAMLSFFKYYNVIVHSDYCKFFNLTKKYLEVHPKRRLDLELAARLQVVLEDNLNKNEGTTILGPSRDLLDMINKNNIYSQPSAQKTDTVVNYQKMYDDIKSNNTDYESFVKKEVYSSDIDGKKMICKEAINESIKLFTERVRIRMSDRDYAEFCHKEFRNYFCTNTNGVDPEDLKKRKNNIIFNKYLFEFLTKTDNDEFNVFKFVDYLMSKCEELGAMSLISIKYQKDVADREIVIQDIYTKASHFHIQMIFKYLSLKWPEELVTKSSAQKLRMIESMTFTNKSLFCNDDMAKWSPHDIKEKFDIVADYLRIHGVLTESTYQILKRSLKAVSKIVLWFDTRLKNPNLKYYLKSDIALNRRPDKLKIKAFTKDNSNDLMTPIEMELGWPQGLMHFISSFTHGLACIMTSEVINYCYNGIILYSYFLFHSDDKNASIEPIRVLTHSESLGILKINQYVPNLYSLSQSKTKSSASVYGSRIELKRMTISGNKDDPIKISEMTSIMNVGGVIYDPPMRQLSTVFASLNDKDFISNHLSIISRISTYLLLSNEIITSEIMYSQFMKFLRNYYNIKVNYNSPISWGGDKDISLRLLVLHGMNADNIYKYTENPERTYYCLKNPVTPGEKKMNYKFRSEIKANVEFMKMIRNSEFKAKMMTDLGFFYRNDVRRILNPSTGVFIDDRNVLFYNFYRHRNEKNLINYNELNLLRVRMEKKEIDKEQYNLLFNKLFMNIQDLRNDDNVEVEHKFDNIIAGDRMYAEEVLKNVKGWSVKEVQINNSAAHGSINRLKSSFSISFVVDFNEAWEFLNDPVGYIKDPTRNFSVDAIVDNIKTFLQAFGIIDKEQFKESKTAWNFFKRLHSSRNPTAMLWKTEIDFHDVRYVLEKNDNFKNTIRDLGVDLIEKTDYGRNRLMKLSSVLTASLYSSLINNAELIRKGRTDEINDYYFDNDLNIHHMGIPSSISFITSRIPLQTIDRIEKFIKNFQTKILVSQIYNIQVHYNDNSEIILMQDDESDVLIASVLVNNEENFRYIVSGNDIGFDKEKSGPLEEFMKRKKKTFSPALSRMLITDYADVRYESGVVSDIRFSINATITRMLMHFSMIKDHKVTKRTIPINFDYSMDLSNLPSEIYGVKLENPLGKLPVIKYSRYKVEIKPSSLKRDVTEEEVENALNFEFVYKTISKVITDFISSSPLDTCNGIDCHNHNIEDHVICISSLKQKRPVELPDSVFVDINVNQTVIDVKSEIRQIETEIEKKRESSRVPFVIKFWNTLGLLEPGIKNFLETINMVKGNANVSAMHMLVKTSKKDRFYFARKKKWTTDKDKLKVYMKDKYTEMGFMMDLGEVVIDSLGYCNIYLGSSYDLYLNKISQSEHFNTLCHEIDPSELVHYNSFKRFQSYWGLQYDEENNIYGVDSIYISVARNFMTKNYPKRTFHSKVKRILSLAEELLKNWNKQTWINPEEKETLEAILKTAVEKNYYYQDDLENKEFFEYRSKKFSSGTIMLFLPWSREIVVPVIQSDIPTDRSNIFPDLQPDILLEEDFTRYFEAPAGIQYYYDKIIEEDELRGIGSNELRELREEIEEDLYWDTKFVKEQEDDPEYKYDKDEEPIKLLDVLKNIKLLTKEDFSESLGIEETDIDLLRLETKREVLEEKLRVITEGRRSRESLDTTIINKIKELKKDFPKLSNTRPLYVLLKYLKQSRESSNVNKHYTNENYNEIEEFIINSYKSNKENHLFATFGSTFALSSHLKTSSLRGYRVDNPLTYWRELYEEFNESFTYSLDIISIILTLVSVLILLNRNKKDTELFRKFNSLTVALKISSLNLSSSDVRQLSRRLSFFNLDDILSMEGNSDNIISKARGMVRGIIGDRFKDLKKTAQPIMEKTLSQILENKLWKQL
ncbi:MAG: RNA-dependent RNA polymerase [Agrocybe praecox tulasvirus 1]|nr:MAG: RNA-dependent RNA polymerase [Agrocybe praecox tulasvirus 1]